jgi:hypothetical protein
MRDNVAYEAALGDHGRSGEQLDIWQAVYSPVGADRNQFLTSVSA